MINIDSSYKLKHIVSLNKDLIKDKFFNFYDNQNYLCRIIYVGTSVIKFNAYSWDEQYNADTDYSLLNDLLADNYEFFRLNFKESDDLNYITIDNIGIFFREFTINMDIKDIEKAGNILSKKLNYLILTEYQSTIYNNREKLLEKEINYKQELIRRDKLLKEIKLMESEKEKKLKKLEKLLTSNKPKTKPNYNKILR